MSGKDHRNNRSVVRNVQPGVCEGFVIRSPLVPGEVCEPGDLVVETDKKAVEWSDGAKGNVVRPVVGLLFAEYDGLVLLVKNNVFDELDADSIDDVVIDLYSEGSH